MISTFNRNFIWSSHPSTPPPLHQSIFSLRLTTIHSLNADKDKSEQDAALPQAALSQLAV